MWRIWLIYDPRRAFTAGTAFVFTIVMVNHFVQLSTPRYGTWLTQPRPAAGQRSSIEVPTMPASVEVPQIHVG
jgi:light-harvesting complex 1 alpha chain